MPSLGPRLHLDLDKPNIIFSSAVVEQREYSVDKMGLFVAKGITGDRVPPSECNENQDDMDMAAFGKRPQLKVRYSRL